MKASIMRKIIIFSASLLLIFSITILIIVYNMNQRTAKETAENLLGVFETQLIDGGYTQLDDYETLVHYYNAKNIRVTVIDLNGTVLADTGNENVSQMENHLSRKEVQQALEGGVGTDIRKSETLGIKFLYTARKVTGQNLQTLEERTVILRVAVPMNSINSYVYGVVLALSAIFAVSIIVAVLISGTFAKSVLRPYELIKNKLDEVLSDDKEAKTIALTKYDDINSIISEIDGISEKLNSNLNEYQLEKEKLSFIIENINQGVIALNKLSEIILCNKQSREFLKFEEDLPALIHKAVHNNTVLKSLEEVRNGGKVMAFDIEESSGEILHYNLFPNMSKDIAIIMVIQDVTDIRKLAIEKQEFFENAGHELKTPLSSILGYSEILLSKEEYNKVFIATINKEALRMKQLISDMLKISELSENVEIIDEQINLVEIVNQVILSYLPKAESKNIILIPKLENCCIYANREKITEVAANLVDNAIKYTDSGGCIKIGLKNESGKAVFTVDDNGIGIPPKYLNRIFERFFRVDKGRSRGEGSTGLGLAIVKHICNRYNAPVSVKSKLGEGTNITILFNII